MLPHYLFSQAYKAAAASDVPINGKVWWLCAVGIVLFSIAYKTAVFVITVADSGPSPPFLQVHLPPRDLDKDAWEKLTGGASEERLGVCLYLKEEHYCGVFYDEKAAGGGGSGDSSGIGGGGVRYRLLVTAVIARVHHHTKARPPIAFVLARLVSLCRQCAPEE